MADPISTCRLLSLEDAMLQMGNNVFSINMSTPTQHYPKTLTFKCLQSRNVLPLMCFRTFVYSVVLMLQFPSAYEWVAVVKPINRVRMNKICT